jgi:hypothetical protein
LSAGPMAASRGFSEKEVAPEDMAWTVGRGRCFSVELGFWGRMEGDVDGMEREWKPVWNWN